MACLVFIWKLKMLNNSSPIKMSIYKNYLGQVQDKVFDKTSHRQVKILNKLHILSLPTVTLCHV